MATLQIVYVYWKILGLCPYVYSNSGLTHLSCGSLIYAVILSLSYTVCYVRAIKDRMTFALPRETPMSILSDFGGLSIEFSVIISSWLYLRFNHKKVQTILMCFKKIHESYDTLGISMNKSRLIRDVNIQTFFANSIWYILCIVDHLLMLNCEPFKLNTWLPFNLPRVVTHNIVVIFVNAMKIIQEKFRLLNKKIQDLPKDVSTRLTIRIKNSQNMISNSKDELKSFVNPGPLEIYGQLHSDLIDLTKIVVNFFSMSILSIILTICFQLASGLYTLCLAVSDREIWRWNDVAAVLVLGSWFTIHFSEMAILVLVSASTAQEANRTGSVLHEVLLDRRMERYANSAKIMSLRLLHRHLKIELFGLFQMSVEIVYRIMGTVITYITIMMQLDDQGDQGKQYIKK